MTDNQTIPATLRAIRAQLNLNQDQLAGRLGVSFATVNRWEGGTTPQKAAQAAIAELAEEAGIGVDDAAAQPAEAAAQITRRRRGAVDRSATPSTKPMDGRWRTGHSFAAAG